MVAFNLFHIKHSPTVKRANFISGIVFPIGLLVFFCFIGLYGQDWGSPVIGAVLCGGLIYFVFGTRRWRVGRAVRKMLSEGSNKGLGPQELELTDTEIVERRESGESRLSRDIIERVGFTPDYAFIYTGAVTALVVPKAKVVEGNYDQLAEILKQKLEDKAQSPEQKRDSYKSVVIDEQEFYKPDTRIGKHSGLGIASFTIAIGVTVLILLGLMVLFVLTATGRDIEDNPVPMGIFAFCFMFAFFASLLGVGPWNSWDK